MNVSTNAIFTSKYLDANGVEAVEYITLQEELEREYELQKEAKLLPRHIVVEGYGDALVPQADGPWTEVVAHPCGIFHKEVFDSYRDWLESAEWMLEHSYYEKIPSILCDGRNVRELTFTDEVFSNVASEDVVFYCRTTSSAQGKGFVHNPVNQDVWVADPGSENDYYAMALLGGKYWTFAPNVQVITPSNEGKVGSATTLLSMANHEEEGYQMELVLAA